MPIDRAYQTKSRFELRRRGSSHASPESSDASLLGVRVLYTPPDHKIDIVFVHGLAGNSRTTWATGSSDPWPMTLLPPKIPNARILTFGYIFDSRISSISKELLTDLAIRRIRDGKDETPLIFVAHSLGGLVVQDCLCIADDNREALFGKILHYTRGIILLATPNSGAQLESLAIESTAINDGGLHLRNSSIAEHLRSNSDVLMRIRHSFNVLLQRRAQEKKPPIEIVSFYETRMSAGFQGMALVVPMEPAILSGYPNFAIDRNHTDIAKFSNPEDPVFMKVVSQLQRLANIILVEAALNETPDALSPDIEDETRTIPYGLSSIGGDIFDQEESQALLSWLSPLDFETRQKDLYSQHLEGTGDWLLKAEQYNEWMSETSDAPSWFWCYGKPASGKSVVTSIVVQRLRSIFPRRQTNAVGVAVLHCGYQEIANQTTLSLLGSIAKQLIQQLDQLPSDAWLLYRRHDRGRSSPSSQEYFEFLNHTLGRFSKTIILVDGLDELEQEPGRTLTNFLMKLQFEVRSSKRPAIVKIYLSSRRFPWIEQQITLCRHVRVCTQENNMADLTLYTIARISDPGSFKLAERLSTDQDLTNILVNTVVKKAEGVFLFVRLYLDSLGALITPRQLRQALSEAPDGLSDVYDNITARISTGGTYSTQLALSVITWVFVARRPLSFLELQHALAVQLGDKDIDREDLIDDISYIISACAGLVTVDSVNGAVRLIHYTFSDYLKWRRQALFMEGADARLADICLTYLLFDTFSTGYLSTDQEVEARLSNYPFLEYAAKYWGEHYRLSLEEFQNKDLEESSASQTKSVPDSKLVPQLMTQKGNFSCAVQFLQLPKERGLGYSQRPPRKASTLWLVSSFGLLDLTKKELSELGHENVKKKIQDKTSNEETALYAAVCNRHEKVVKILLRAGANPATCGGEFGSALQAASALGYEDMVRLLMTKENVNATCGTYGTALQAAAAHGREEIVSLLLKEHADVNLLAGKYGTALKAASSTGYENVVQILLENNAKVEVEDPSETTQTATDTSALFNATIMGSESIVRLLLEHGADVNKTGGTSGNLRPLHKAVQSGNLAIVTLLLEHGADVSANSKEGTALHWAARFGDFNMARLLLEFGADVEARDERDRTPLFLAAEETDTPSVAKLLLSAGANCETKDKEESTPLIAAAIRGNEHIVSLLYENGADIEARNSNGTRPLLAAASNGNALVVAFLLSRGADTEVEDSEGATPLIAAANNGHVQVAYILLQHGVQFTSETWESSELSSQAREVLERAVAKGLLKSPSNGHGNWEFLQSLWGNRSKSGNQSTATTDSKIKVSESGEKNELEAVGVWADSDNPALLVENHSEMEELD